MGRLRRGLVGSQRLLHAQQPKGAGQSVQLPHRISPKLVRGNL